MNKCRIFIITVFIAAGIIVNPVSVKAQLAGVEQAGGVKEKVIVTASPYVSRRIVSNDSSGILTETLTLQRYVSYADLDLRKYAHVTELKGRIESNAKQVCRELADQYAVPSQEDADMQKCIKLAIESANDGLVAAITAAH